MARIFTNNAEGGTAGVAVTSGNSGGASGDPLPIIGNPGGGATITYTDQDPLGGLLSYRLAHPSGGGQGVIVRITPNTVAHAQRFRQRVSSYPTVAAVIMYAGNGATLALSLVVGTDGRVGVQNAAGAITYFGSSLPLDGSATFELAATRGTTSSNGSVSTKWYTTDPNNPEGSFQSSAFNAGTLSFTRIQWGRHSGTWSSLVQILDDLAVDDQAVFIGPAEAMPEVHTTSGAADARATASGATSSTRTASATAAATASAAADTASTRTSARTATAVAVSSAVSTSSRLTAGTAIGRAAGSEQHATTRNASGTAGSVASASAVSTQQQTEVRATSGTAAAEATSAASTGTVRAAVGSALARAVAYASTGSAHTGVGTASAAGLATATTATIRAAVGTATSRAGAVGFTATRRVVVGTALAYVTASGFVGHGPDLRDVTVTWGPLTTRTLAGTMTAGALTGTLRTRTLTGTLED